MMLTRVFLFFCLALQALPARTAGDDIRFDIQVVPGLERYVDLLAQPGLLAIALENNGLNPSISSKLKVAEEGRAAEIRSATLKFTGRKGTVFNYEAGYLLGIGDTKISFPVAIDVSGISSGKVTAILTPPLAALIPVELTDKIRMKAGLIANAAAQRKVVEYLDRQPKDTFAQAILIDAFNRSGGPGVATRDVGVAVPLSDQWLLILTLIIWLIVLPVVLFWHRLRRAPQKPA